MAMGNTPKSAMHSRDVNAGIFNMFKLWQFKDNEMQVYNLLARSPMTIKQLQKTTRMSERSLRTYLDDLVDKRCVKRNVIEGKHLKYVYYANSGENLLGIIKKQIDEIEKSRQKSRDEIVKGTEEIIKK